MSEVDTLMIHERFFFTKDQNLRAKAFHVHLHHLLVKSGSLTKHFSQTKYKQSILHLHHLLVNSGSLTKHCSQTKYKYKHKQNIVHLHHLLVNSGSIVASPVDAVVKRSGHLAHIQNFIHTPSFLNPHIVDLIGRHIVARVPESKFFNPAWRVPMISHEKAKRSDGTHLTATQPTMMK